MAKKRNGRQDAIRDIVRNKDVRTQRVLVDELRAMGFDCTQATVSRDIKELRIIKTLDGLGGYHYSAPQTHDVNRFDSRFRVIFRECVTNIDFAQNLIVVKTVPGLGAAAGANIDALHMPDVVGTLSGDDTTLVIMRDNASAAEFCAEIHKMLD